MADDLTVSLRQGMASVGAAARQAGASVDQLAQKTSAYARQAQAELAQVGRMMQKIGGGLGGALGGVTGRLGGAVSTGGTVGTLAAGAAAAGAVWGALQRAGEVFASRAEATADALARLREAARSAEAAQRSFAASAVDEGALLARAEFEAGPSARAQAEALVQSTGVTLRQALEIVAETAGDMVTARAAGLALRTGRITGAAEAVRAVTAARQQAAEEQFAAWAEGAEAPAAPQDEFWLAARAVARAPDEREGVVRRLREGSPARRRLEGARSAEDITTRAALDAFMAGRTEVALRREAAARIDPFSAAQLEAYSAFVEQAQKLQDLAQATPLLVSVFQRLASTAGDAELQLRRLQRAAGAAVRGAQE